MTDQSAGRMRLCPLCQKPAALQQCCPLGKIPCPDWEMEHMPIFLDILATETHKWIKLGSLGDMVNASLGDGGYKEVFKKERIVGKLLFGKQRKTVSDMMKRIGIKNVKHRDLLVEVIFDLSKPVPPQSDEEMMAAKFALVRNTWSKERMPEIQLHALSDVLASSADESQHELLQRFNVLQLLVEIIDGNMMDPEREKNLQERQTEIDELWKRRRKRELDYEQKKDLDRKEHLQAQDWLKWKADFGSLAVAAYAALQNLSKSQVFSKDIAQGVFPDMIVVQLDRCRDAEKRLTLLKAMGKGQYMSLVASEVAEQQMMLLNIVCNLSLEPANRAIICSKGVCEAVVKVASAPTVRDTPRFNQCIRIFCNLSIGAGETEERMVKDGVLGPVVNSIREGLREVLLFSISTVTNLAFVEENRDPLIDSGVLIPLTKILREENESPEKLKAIDAVRNLAAARADLRFAKIVVDELMDIVQNGAAEERLRCLIALRSITRFEETLQICEEQGVIRKALALIEHDDNRVRTQAIGLLINVIGFSAIVPMDPDEEDELSDSELLSDDEDEIPESPGSRPKTTDSSLRSSAMEKTEPLAFDAMNSKSIAVEDNTKQIADKQEDGDNGQEVAVLANTQPDNTVAEDNAHWERLEEAPHPGELVGADRPLQRANKLMQMRLSPFFRLLQERELQLLALNSEYFILNKGEALVVQGDSCQSIYVVIKGIVRVLIGAKGAGKWAMHRISRNKDRRSKEQMSPVVDDKSPDSPKSLTNVTDDLSSPMVKALKGTTDSPAVVDSPVEANRGGGGTGATFRAGKNTREVARLRPGDSANELCVMEGRKSLATLVGMTDTSVIMDLTPKQLADILLDRPEFKDAITSGEMIMLSDLEKLRRVWKHPAMSDEAAEKSNLFRIESSERRAKIQRHLLAIGAVEVFERNFTTETKLMTKTMFQIGLTLLIGSPENKDNPLLLVEEDVIEQIKGIIECSRHGEDFYGHYYECEKVLLAMRLLAMNDTNKRKFVQNAIIPFVLSILQESSEEVLRLATAILLELSFGMQARWLLRPILGIWNKYVQGAKAERTILAIPPPLTDAVDIAAPTHLVQVRALEAEPTFSQELHEAAYEGGQQWIERLVEEDAVPADTTDAHGATGMHFAAMNARFEAMSYFMDHGLDINVEDNSGCTPLAWYVMARNIEFGTNQEVWPEECKKALDWMTSQGAVTRFIRMFSNTV